MPARFTFLLVEAAQVTVRSDCDWRRQFFYSAMRRGRRVAKAAMARRLAVRLCGMWRKEWVPNSGRTAHIKISNGTNK
jgi:hypothetical protein